MENSYVFSVTYHAACLDDIPCPSDSGEMNKTIREGVKKTRFYRGHFTLSDGGGGRPPSRKKIGQNVKNIQHALKKPFLVTQVVCIVTSSISIGPNKTFFKIDFFLLLSPSWTVGEGGVRA